MSREILNRICQANIGKITYYSSKNKYKKLSWLANNSNSNINIHYKYISVMKLGNKNYELIIFSLKCINKALVHIKDNVKVHS